MPNVVVEPAFEFDCDVAAPAPEASGRVAGEQGAAGENLKTPEVPAEKQEKQASR